METLDEFDNEYPLNISFCERISPLDFERESFNYTQKSLQDLYIRMDQNPEICERVVRKRMQVENEEAGLMQYLKVKFFSLFQGDVNYTQALSELEMREQVVKLKQEMQKASSYAQAAKSGLLWPVEKRIRKNISLDVFTPNQTKPPEPAAPAMPKVFGSFSKQMEKTLGSNTDLKHLWVGMSSVNQKSLVDLCPLMLNPGGFRPSFLASNSVRRLKYPSFQWAPANSPASSSQSPGPGPSSSASVFNTPVQAKFRGTKDDKMDDESPASDSPPKSA